MIFYLRSIFGVALRVYFPRSGVSLALADIYFWVSQPPEKPKGTLCDFSPWPPVVHTWSHRHTALRGSSQLGLTAVGRTSCNV